MTLVRLPLTDIGRLRAIHPTLGADPWVAEAEQFVVGAELPDLVRRYKDDLSIWVEEQGDVVLGVGVTYPDPRFCAIRIGVIVVNRSSRRQGAGRRVLDGLVAMALASGETICWAVHSDNAPMLACSRNLVPRPDEALMADDYMLFVAS